MYLLYLDDSGSVGNADDKYIILAGICVYEQAPYWLSNRLDGLAKEFWPDHYSSVEFHGTDIFGGRHQWHRIRDKGKRIDIYKRALNIISESANARLFGAAIHKAAISPEDPLEYAFEQLCSRFDRFIKRLHHGGDAKQRGQRGLIVLDKSSYETSLQGLSREFRVNGHNWGVTRNIVEVPLFVDSKATRMIQYADLIAFALRHKYEYGDPYYYHLIANKFDKSGGVVHGLHHYNLEGSSCECVSCGQKLAYKKSKTTRKYEENA